MVVTLFHVFGDELNVFASCVVPNCCADVCVGRDQEGINKTGDHKLVLAHYVCGHFAVYFVFITFFYLWIHHLRECCVVVHVCCCRHGYCFYRDCFLLSCVFALSWFGCFVWQWKCRTLVCDNLSLRSVSWNAFIRVWTPFFQRRHMELFELQNISRLE